MGTATGSILVCNEHAFSSRFLLWCEPLRDPELLPQGHVGVRPRIASRAARAGYERASLVNR